MTDWVTRAGQAHLKQKAEAISSAAFTLADALDREVSADEMLAAALREVISQCQNGQGVILTSQLLLIADILEKSTIDDSLSPAAQAVLNAYENSPQTGFCLGEQKAIAAALRVLADQVVPENYDPPRTAHYPEAQAFVDGKECRNADVRYQILAIAAELDGL